MPNTTPYDLVVGSGSCWINSTASPANWPALNASPAGTSASWVALGDTDGGIVFTLQKKTKDLYVDQNMGPVKTIMTDRGGEVSFTLARVDPTVMSLLVDGATPSTVAAGASTAGYNAFDFTTTACAPSYQMLVRMPGSEVGYANAVNQIELFNVVLTSDVKWSFGKKDDYSKVPTTWSMYDSSASAGRAGQIKFYSASPI